MQLFQTFQESIPVTLAFQGDALTNAVGDGSASGTAATGAAPGGAAGTGAPAPSPNPFGLMGPILLVMVFFIGFSILTSRREKKRREALLASIKKGEKVLTIGGIIGTIADIRDDEVVLKIDESSNVKMRVTRSSIQTVLKSVPDGAGAGDSGGAKGGAGTLSGQVEVKTGKGAKVAT